MELRSYFLSRGWNPFISSLSAYLQTVRVSWDYKLWAFHMRQSLPWTALPCEEIQGFKWTDKPKTCIFPKIFVLLKTFYLFYFLLVFREFSMFDHIHLLLQLFPDPLSLSYPTQLCLLKNDIPISLHCLFIVSCEASCLRAPSLSEATLLKKIGAFSLRSYWLSGVPCLGMWLGAHLPFLFLFKKIS